MNNNFLFFLLLLFSSTFYGFLAGTNVTDVDWGGVNLTAMTDDNLEEEEEREDEREHAEESEEWATEEEN